MRKVACLILILPNANPFLKLRGKEILVWLLEKVSLFKEIVLVCGKGMKKDLKKIIRNRKIKKIKIVELERKKFSLIYAIKKGMKSLKKKYFFLVASNMPFVLEKTFRELMVRMEKNVNCICYFWSLKDFESLCAIYSKNFFRNARRNDRLENLIRKSRKKILVPISRETFEFFKINSKKDLKKAEKILSDEKWKHLFLS